MHVKAYTQLTRGLVNWTSSVLAKYFGYLIPNSYLIIIGK